MQVLGLYRFLSHDDNIQNHRIDPHLMPYNQCSWKSVVELKQATRKSPMTERGS
jgi:hypothetical protein